MRCLHFRAHYDARTRRTWCPCRRTYETDEDKAMKNGVFYELKNEPTSADPEAQ